MYTIRKEFHFSASHSLDCLSQDHPCSRVHGHNYIVVVELKSKKLNEAGMVVDYRELQPIKEYIDTTLDHQHLNDVISYNPTAENIACHLFHLTKQMFPQVAAVEVLETPKTKARYAPA